MVSASTRTRAQFDWSEIKHAYNGILVERPGGRAEVADSKLDSCLFAGAYGEQGLLDVSLSDVSYNGVYGIYYVTHNDTVLHCGVSNCTLNYNGLAGVSISGPATSSILAPSQVTSNLIDGGGMTSHGIEAADNASWTSIENNQVTGCDQAGIALTSSAPGLSANQISGCNNTGIEIWSSSPNVDLNQVSGCGQAGLALHSSSPSLVRNTVQNNGSIGIVCLEGSNPYVRRNTVSQHRFGVSCDGSSYPDLGTANDSGNNIIDTTNIWWVDKKQNSQNMDSVQARLNYWGVPDPSLHPGKFIGRVAYAPWLPEPPQGGGQQSAGVVAQPLVTSLGRVQPMPMRCTARIPFELAHAGRVALGIVDASGRVVRTLVRGERGAGRYSEVWNRADDHGRSVPAGVYFCTLSAENKRFCKKVILTE